MKKKEIFSHSAVVFGLALISCLLWGSAIPMIKTGYRLLGIENTDTWAQILFAGLRFTLAGILTLILGSLIGGMVLRPARHTWARACLLSLAQTIGQYFFFYIGVANTTGVKSSILTATGTFFAILTAGLLLKQEKLTAGKLMGCLLGFLGVVLVNLAGGQIDFGFSLQGEGFMLISAAASGLASVMISRFSEHEKPVMLSGCQFLIGGIVLILIGLGMGGRLQTFSPVIMGILLYLSMVSAVAYSLWALLLSHNPVSKVTVYGFMTPICGVVLSALILKESSSLGWSAVVALLLISAGIILVNKPVNLRDRTHQQQKPDSAC